jgi:hypothetical protein
MRPTTGNAFARGQSENSLSSGGHQDHGTVDSITGWSTCCSSEAGRVGPSTRYDHGFLQVSKAFVLEAVPNGSKFNQDLFIGMLLPELGKEKRRFTEGNRVITPNSLWLFCFLKKSGG